MAALSAKMNIFVLLGSDPPLGAHMPSTHTHCHLRPFYLLEHPKALPAALVMFLID